MEYKLSISPIYDKISTGYYKFEKLKIVSDYNIWPLGETIEEDFKFGLKSDYYSFSEANRN